LAASSTQSSASTLQAELAARELGHLNLADALALATLIAQETLGDTAARRFAGTDASPLETKGLELADSQLLAPLSPHCPNGLFSLELRARVLRREQQPLS
jgi:hypothetical protein